jgi:exodeoxyribonuclease V beta subunit
MSWTSLQLQVAPGTGRRVLVEASAGTGKTWTIAALYLRLVLELGHRAEHIVVTTFTEAAADELRERIRRQLRDALACADAARTGKDDIGVWLAQRWARGERERDTLRLRLALADLDRAPIGTIHALCRRVLADQPFAAGAVSMQNELVPAQDLVAELADDLARYAAQALLDEDEQRAARAYLAMNDRERRRQVQFLLRPNLTLVADAGLVALMREAQPRADEIAALAKRDVFAKRKTALRNRLDALAAYLRAGDLDAELDIAKAFGDAEVRDQVRPELVDLWLSDPLVTFATGCARRFSDCAAALAAPGWLRFAGRLREWRVQRLAQRQQTDFDQLIATVHDAVTRQRDGGEHLADVLAQRWAVALIDEFQDTDAQQYGLFDAVFRAADGRTRGLLLMIGDPKQAIYRFRGGDIATYLRAAAGVDDVLQLGMNHRASTALVTATNGFYAAIPDPFGTADARIDYVPVSASRRHDDAVPRRGDGDAPMQPLHFHVADSEDADEEEALAACASLVVDYLYPGRWRIGRDARALRPDDIAVLLPEHRQVDALRQMLMRRNVPCTTIGRSSVFASGSADDLRLVLHAIADPGDAAALRAALGCALLGFDAAALNALGDDLAAWQRQANRFERWSLQWQRAGVMRAIEELIEDAAPRLLAGHDGERRIADLRQLGELLQHEAQQRPGREALLAWFAAQCETADGADEVSSGDRLLRIETERSRVRLMTLHGSKGLEFEIVLLPLMWAQNARQDVYPFYTDADGRRIADLARSPDATAFAERENLEDRLRLLYVALTRARQACHVFVPRWPTETMAAKDAALLQLLARADLAQLRATPTLAIDHGWIAHDERLPREQDASRRRVARTPRRHVATLAVHSFSSLVHAARARVTDEETAVVDERPPEALYDAPADDLPDAELLALSQYRGTAFGTAVHGVFEHRVPALPMSEQLALVRDQLQAAGLRVSGVERDQLATRVAARVQACLDAELLPGLRLGDLAPEAQRAELGFQWLLDQASLHALRDCARRHGEPDLVPEGLSERTLSGFLGGRIDLCLRHEGRVHVLDYKSNELGDHLSAYREDALRKAMTRDHYPFQAFLYMLALDRYLATRIDHYDRARHLGDCLYLYVRALGRGPDLGLWRHRFADALIDEAQHILGVEAMR